jgi:hypothetical protein
MPSSSGRGSGVDERPVAVTNRGRDGTLLSGARSWPAPFTYGRTVAAPML